VIAALVMLVVIRERGRTGRERTPEDEQQQRSGES
jgi:hypothetical protein